MREYERVTHLFFTNIKAFVPFVVPFVIRFSLIKAFPFYSDLTVVVIISYAIC